MDGLESGRFKSAGGKIGQFPVELKLRRCRVAPWRKLDQLTVFAYADCKNANIVIEKGRLQTVRRPCVNRASA